MAIDCGPYLLLKEFGASLALVSAAAAWLVNRFLAWVVWFVGRHLRRYELLCALESEISSNHNGESIYDPKEIGGAQLQADDLIAKLRDDVGPYKPLMPYVAASEGNPVYESVLSDLSVLPADVCSPVVRYYSASVALTEQLKDFRSDAFVKLSQQRQKTVIGNLYAVIGAECGETGRKALSRIRLWVRAYRALLIVVILCGVWALISGWNAAIRTWPSVSWSLMLAAESASSCATSNVHLKAQPI